MMQAYPKLVEHRIFLHYPIPRREDAWDSPPEISRLGQLVTGALTSWIYPEARDRFAGDQSGTPLWEPLRPKIGHDLHPHIRKVLNSEDIPKDREGAAAPDTSSYGLHHRQGIQRFLQGKWTGRAESRRLLLEMPEAARVRICEQRPEQAGQRLFLAIHDLNYISFRTGWAIVRAEVGIDLESGEPPQLEICQEVVRLLGQFNRLYWINPANAGEETSPFSLGQLIRGLACREEGRAERRVFSALYLRFQGKADPQLIRRYAMFACRKYSGDHSLSEQVSNIHLIEDFDNLIHGITQEGVATVVLTEEENNPAFLRDFLHDRYKNHYLPILLLACHEYIQLVRLTNDSSFWPELEKQESLHRLNRLRDDILKFRLCFRYSTISNISTHNVFNQALRKAMNLDGMLDELDRDTKEIDGYLQQEAQRRVGERLKLPTAIGAIGVGSITSFEFFKELFAVTSSYYQIPDPSLIGTLSVITGLIVGLTAGLLIYRH